jgi:HD-GYP domain-containing protein (c-di-GMP phosphodiesterase class II)
MLRVPIIAAKPGMVLALPVFHPRRPDTMLLKLGMRLDERSIRRLREIRLRQIWIAYPGADFAAEYICPAVFEAQAALTWQVSRALEAVSSGAHARLEYGEYRGAISGLLTRLVANPAAAVFIQELAEREDRTLRHASTVCLLSLLMGLKLDDYLVVERSRLGASHARDVTNLGVGAMLHDIGMLRLDPAVVQRWNRALDESDPEWRRHVLTGFEMVKDAIGPAAAAGVLHHHQRFDGSGFPRRALRTGADEPVRGSDIHIFARIIAAADLYDRIRWSPAAPEGDAPLPAVRVLRRLQEEPYVRWLDPMVYTALLAVVPAYAPGTMVTLSDGRSGVVVEWFPDDPCRPTLAITGNDPERALDRPERLSLRACPDLAVARAEGEDVSADNFYPSIPGQYDLRLARKALTNSAARDAA